MNYYMREYPENHILRKGNYSFWGIISNNLTRYLQKISKKRFYLAARKKKEEKIVKHTYKLPQKSSFKDKNLPELSS